MGVQRFFCLGLKAGWLHWSRRWPFQLDAETIAHLWARPPWPAPPATTVGDTVWGDKNKDGRQDPGEPGIPGVEVTLKDAAGNTVGTQTTDSNGHYQFFDARASP